MFKSNCDFDHTTAVIETVDGPAEQVPTSLVLGVVAATLVTPVALLPFAGWWAAKNFSK